MTLPAYEKLGAFYLGRGFDLASGERDAAPLLYDSKDLTTHAVIIGMTGSGKTGLGIGLLEEAALDGVPVIAIDPKGDLGNILLTFPELRGADFAPWVSAQEAAAKGVTPEAFAEQQAALWSKGFGEWEQDGARIARLRAAADFRIYTPGSSAGTPISVLRSFAAPPPAIRDDRDLFRERIQTTATSVLALLGIEADPLTSREHILVSTLLQHAWSAGRDLDVPALIAQIQQPPVRQIGVMDLEAVYPQRDRFALAMQLNNLLAAPGFEAWTEGVPLDAGRLLFGPDGKPQVSVVSIAHLGDAERMFFVCMLLNDVIGWMRQQPGTGSLRAILYMDELFGYLPPVANPASKALFLTLLKQARAFGLGVVLATQNPVDLDYKALSNAGTWFIGRLQTERDKARVMEGLEGAASGGAFDRAATERLIAGLGKRVFLLHSVHEPAPVTFQTRWTLSYLAGPFTREQIRRLADAAPADAAPAAAGATPRAAGAANDRPPVLPPGIRSFVLPARVEGELTYLPHAIGIADVAITSAKHRIDRTDRLVHLAPAGDGPVAVEWADAQAVALRADALDGAAVEGARYAECPASLQQAKAWPAIEKAYERWLKATQSLTLWRSPAFRLLSEPGESERDFRIRLQQAAHEQRDAQVEALRKKYAPKVGAAQEKVRRAEGAVAREAEQASAAKMTTAISVGTAVLGALFGRRTIGAGTMTRAGTAMRGATRASKEAGDVARAEASLAAAREALAALEAEVQAEVEALAGATAALDTPLEEVALKPKASDVHVHAVGLAWAPFTRDAAGALHAAW